MSEMDEIAGWEVGGCWQDKQTGEPVTLFIQNTDSPWRYVATYQDGRSSHAMSFDNYRQCQPSLLVIRRQP